MASDADMHASTRRMVHCLECGEGFPFRRGKKFCSDKCRAYYNSLLTRPNLEQRETMRHLLQQYRMLLDALGTRDKHLFRKSTLMRKGFDLETCTRVFSTEKGQYLQLFDLVYSVQGERVFVGKALG